MEIDHVFILCSPGAPEAQALVSLGLVEGSRNVHPGQGTACRRFFFENFYVELLWVHNAEEAQAAPTRRTQLWERWRGRDRTSPFGIVLRPSASDPRMSLPFPTWSYQPAYLPAGVSIEIAVGTPIDEPEFFYLPFQRERASAAPGPVDHSIPMRRFTGLIVGLPSAEPSSLAARSTAAAGLLSIESSRDHVLLLTFDGHACGMAADLRPEVPLVFRW